MGDFGEEPETLRVKPEDQESERSVEIEVPKGFIFTA